MALRRSAHRPGGAQTGTAIYGEVVAAVISALLGSQYGATVLVSGAVIAGFLSWLAVRGLAKTGALDRFAAGREITKRV